MGQKKILEVIKKKTCQARFLYPVEIYLKRQNKDIFRQTEAKFITSRSTSREEEVLQAQGT